MNEAINTLENFFKTKKSPEDSPVLTNVLQRFFFDFYPHKADAATVWARLMHHNPLKTKGSKVNINRLSAYMPACLHAYLYLYMPAHLPTCLCAFYLSICFPLTYLLSYVFLLLLFTYLPSCIQLLINGFMGAIKKGIEEEGNWTMTYFIYLLTCIES